ncbi:glycerate kinase [Aspergillus parasiticus]|uniref:Glycerate kinase n=1 Tax=Aspergillus parasiticus TaxID=5067 RepID=A0A5N6E1X2_ASPPA|nr:glycerate kinase [Aspergillus parasiticus]
MISQDYSYTKKIPSFYLETPRSELELRQSQTCGPRQQLAHRYVRLGTGLLLLGAMLRPRYEAIMEYFNIEGLFEDGDLILTAEGGIDYQTTRGEIPAEVAIRVKKYHIPVIVLAGTIGDEAEVNYDVRINAYASILQRPSTLAEAVAESE